MANPIVAIVGRPNVGKSTIFNRIAGERISIVEDTPGVTRDRIYTHCEWLGKKFNMIDTGGIDMGNEPFVIQIKEQAEIAIDEADVIIFVVSAKEGVTDADEKVAKILYKTDKPVFLAVNKVDNPEMRNEIYDFYSLGFGDPMPISGVHGIGIGDLLDKVINAFPKDADQSDEFPELRPGRTDGRILSLTARKERLPYGHERLSALPGGLLEHHDPGGAAPPAL